MKPLDDKTAIAAFLLSEQGSRQASIQTIKTYEQALTQAAHFAEQERTTLLQWTKRFVQTWAMFLHQKKLSPRSIALKLSALRMFYKYGLQQRWLQDNPAIGVRAPKVAKRLPATLDVDETQALLEHLPADQPLALRDKAMMELFYSSGLRLSELQQLTLNDWQTSESGLRVLGKGSKQRDVPVGRAAHSAITAWLAVREQCQPIGDALFVSQNGQALSTRQIQHRLAQWGKKLGLNSRLHPHKLRHACATHFLEGSGDLRAVQELLGHANLSTTQIYTHLDFQKLAAVYDGAHPRAKKK